jgi:hypothetical protein
LFSYMGCFDVLCWHYLVFPVLSGVSFSLSKENVGDFSTKTDCLYFGLSTRNLGIALIH